MTEFYGEAQRKLQDRFGTRRLADAEEQMIVTPALDDAQRGFIESRDMVFLTSVDRNGQPTVSYKGGAPGFLRVVDGAILMPCYDGNGMYLSMGNVDGDPRVGLLFIDFERPNRLRVHGRARLIEADATPGAEMMLSIVPHEIFVNCPRYIHTYERKANSRYVPDAAGEAPLAEWKRIDVVQDLLVESDRRRVEDAGTITMEAYEHALREGRG